MVFLKVCVNMLDLYIEAEAIMLNRTGLPGSLDVVLQFGVYLICIIYWSQVLTGPLLIKGPKRPLTSDNTRYSAMHGGRKEERLLLEVVACLKANNQTPTTLMWLQQWGQDGQLLHYPLILSSIIDSLINISMVPIFSVFHFPRANILI